MLQSNTENRTGLTPSGLFVCGGPRVRDRITFYYRIGKQGREPHSFRTAGAFAPHGDGLGRRHNACIIALKWARSDRICASRQGRK